MALRESHHVAGRGTALVTAGSVIGVAAALAVTHLFSSLPSRRVFALTPAGARSLALTRGVRERLWAGVRLQPLLE